MIACDWPGWERAYALSMVGLWTIISLTCIAVLMCQAVVAIVKAIRRRWVWFWAWLWAGAIRTRLRSAMDGFVVGTGLVLILLMIPLLLAGIWRVAAWLCAIAIGRA